jgi:hypothetical protein
MNENSTEDMITLLPPLAAKLCRSFLAQNEVYRILVVILSEAIRKLFPLKHNSVADYEAIMSGPTP